MRITVFGGDGFLGRYIVQRLAAADHLIRVAVRHPQDAHFLRPMGAVGQITPIECDIKNSQSVKTALTGVDAAINLVGVLYERGRQTFEAVHHQAIDTLVDHAQAAGLKRLIHISAITADLKSTSAYARSKAKGEERIRKSSLNWTILRPSVVFGPEDQFFNLFAQMAVFSPVLPLIGGGTTRLQPAYVGDVADAVMACFGSSDTIGKTYELGGPHVYTFKTLLEQILIWTNRRCWLLPIPFTAAKIIGHMNRILPKPLITGDQVRLLQHDAIVAKGALGFGDLGITPKTIEAIVPTYLKRYQRMA